MNADWRLTNTIFPSWPEGVRTQSPIFSASIPPFYRGRVACGLEQYMVMPSKKSKYLRVTRPLEKDDGHLLARLLFWVIRTRIYWQMQETSTAGLEQSSRHPWQFLIRRHRRDRRLLCLVKRPCVEIPAKSRRHLADQLCQTISGESRASKTADVPEPATLLLTVFSVAG